MATAAAVRHINRAVWCDLDVPVQARALRQVVDRLRWRERLPAIHTDRTQRVGDVLGTVDHLIRVAPDRADGLIGLEWATTDRLMVNAGGDAASFALHP